MNFTTRFLIHLEAVERREFLRAALVGMLPLTERDSVPVIDSHIHLFDISRPQGVPWPAKDSPIYQSALPERLRGLASRFGVVGAIEIECSPWPEDNQWVLDVAAKDTIVVGTIGDLEPGATGFGKQLEELHKNRLFRGIRYGNLWDRDLARQLANPDFVRGMKLLASAGLVLDTANPTPALMHATLRLSDAAPDLKIVLDHLPELAAPEDAAARKAFETDMRELSARPQVYAKVSGIVRSVNGHVPLDIAFYRDRLNRISDGFGADRLMFGSDWPNCELWATYPQVFKLGHAFIAGEDRETIEKFYWRNALRFYGWVKRDGSQPGNW